MAKKKANSGLSAAVKAAGSNVSKNEALKIAESTGKTVAQVMAKAVDKGATLGASLVNNYNKGNLGPNGQNVTNFGGVPIGMGANGATTRAIASLAPLQGLQMGRGQVYAGSSTTTTPGRSGTSPSSGSWHTPGTTTYNPIVLPKGLTAAGQKAPATTQTTTTDASQQGDAMKGATNEWGDSVDQGQLDLQAMIQAQMEANAQQTSLYMGMMQDMMNQMQGAQQQQQQVGAYATTTTAQTPAAGAQQTQAVTARKPIANDTLSIASLPSLDSGVGFNLAI